MKKLNKSNYKINNTIHLFYEKYCGCNCYVVNCSCGCGNPSFPEHTVYTSVMMSTSSDNTSETNTSAKNR